MRGVEGGRGKGRGDGETPVDEVRGEGLRGREGEVLCGLAVGEGTGLLAKGVVGQ